MNHSAPRVPHFGGGLGGFFLRYMESPPGLLPFYGRSLGGDICVIWLQPALRRGQEGHFRDPFRFSKVF